jgi:hypothetical protein
MPLRSPVVFELGAERRDEFGAFLGPLDAGQNLTRVGPFGGRLARVVSELLLFSDANYRAASLTVNS